LLKRLATIRSCQPVARTAARPLPGKGTGTRSISGLARPATAAAKDLGPAGSETDNWYYLPPSKANLAQLRVPIPPGYPRSG
jgi:hypothetical protein